MAWNKDPGIPIDHGKSRGNPIKIDDLGVALFKETTTWASK